MPKQTKVNRQKRQFKSFKYLSIYQNKKSKNNKKNNIMRTIKKNYRRGGTKKIKDFLERLNEAERRGMTRAEKQYAAAREEAEKAAAAAAAEAEKAAAAEKEAAKKMAAAAVAEAYVEHLKKTETEAAEKQKRLREIKSNPNLSVRSLQDWSSIYGKVYPKRKYDPEKGMVPNIRTSLITKPINRTSRL
jgi:hypothetical protein